MVNDLLVRYRSLGLFQQALIAGAVFLLIYTPYLYFVNNMTVVQAVRVSTSSALLFLSVFYLTSVLIARKRGQAGVAEPETWTPKKGLRKK